MTAAQPSSLLKFSVPLSQTVLLLFRQLVGDPDSAGVHGDGDCNSSQHSHRPAELHLQRSKKDRQTAICHRYHVYCHSIGVQQIS